MKTFIAVAMLVSAATAIGTVAGVAACKQSSSHDSGDTPVRAGFQPEIASDGKRMVQGCIWALGGEHADDLAFCDDGRVCVRSDRNDDWKCVRWPR